MTSISYLNLVVFLLFCVTGITGATPAMARDPDEDVKRVKYEEYIIEHEISATQARNHALCTDINTISVPAGCQECTKEEMHYCTSSDLISDHCCCDRRYHEILPYIPHTCYLGTQLCTTIAVDCNRYTRLRTCCCDKYLLQKWKEKYGYSGASHQSVRRQNAFFAFLLLLCLSVVNILNIVV